MAEATLPPGCRHLPGFLDRPDQEALVSALRLAVAAAPFFTPVMPRTGKPFSVQMTNVGSLGWVSDVSGYRYQPSHPVTGGPWPAIPAELLQIWRTCLPEAPEPQACLVNLYRGEARMGLHQDRDEQALEVPVVSVSLGDSAMFRMSAAPQRGGPTTGIRLESGDVFVFGGESRLNFHGISRVYAETSDLLVGGGRLNLTLRRVTAVAGQRPHASGSVAASPCSSVGRAPDF